MPIYYSDLEFTAFPLLLPHDTPELLAFILSLQGTAGSALQAQQPFSHVSPLLSRVWGRHCPKDFHHLSSKSRSMTKK